MKLFLLFLFLLAVVLEVSVTTIPFIFLALLFLTILYRNYWVYVIGFSLGLLLDILGFRSLGLTSTFFLVFMFLVLAYQAKFEIFTLPFIFISSFLGSFLYLRLFVVQGFPLTESLFSSLIAVGFFVLLRKLSNNNFLDLDKRYG